MRFIHTHIYTVFFSFRMSRCYYHVDVIINKEESKEDIVENT